MPYRNVLVISPSAQYLDDSEEALAERGAMGVFAPDLEWAVQALDDGFQPELVLLDPVLVEGPYAEELVVLLRAAPQLVAVPVLAIAGGDRVDRAALFAALEKLDGGGATPLP